MNATFKSGALSLGLAMILAGCPVDNNTSIGILGSPGWQAETEEDDAGNTVIVNCVAPATAEVYFSASSFDVAVSSSFSRPFIARNNLPGNADPSSSRLNTADYMVEKVVIDYAGMDEVSDALVSTLSTEVAAGVTVTSDGGVQGITVPLIPSNVGQVLADQLVPNDGDVRTVLATIRLGGTTLDGSYLESQSFRFPVNVCRGCTGGCTSAECACSHFVQ